MTSRMGTHALSGPLADARRSVMRLVSSDPILSCNRKDAAQPMWGQRFGAVQMDLRSTSNYEKPFDPPAISSWGRPSGLQPGFRPARSFPVTSGRFFNGVGFARVRARNGMKMGFEPGGTEPGPRWIFEGAGELPLGAELFVGAAGPAGRIFNGPMNRDEKRRSLRG